MVAALSSTFPALPDFGTASARETGEAKARVRKWLRYLFGAAYIGMLLTWLAVVVL